MVELSHFDESGASRMVDVTGKEVTLRTARASGRVEFASLRRSGWCGIVNWPREMFSRLRGWRGSWRRSGLAS